MMWEWHSGWAWWWMGVGMLAFWGLVALVIVTLVRQGDRSGRGKGRGGQEILDERYAKGEIEDDEYRRRSELIDR
jgi:putative membrane protein